MSPQEIKDTILRVRKNMRVTKVVATRAVKTKAGDFFAGMSAAWDSVQDDAGGPGADLDPMVSTGDAAASGMDIQEARVAQVMLSMEAGMAAWRAAQMEGAVTEEECENRIARIRARAMSQVNKILAPNTVAKAS
jgi:hypothetical protein